MHPQTPVQLGGLIRPLVAGLLTGLPGAILLTYLAVLPFFLGLFFFMLVGLLIGAIMFRAGARARPVPRSGIWTIGCLIVIFIWSTTLVTEYLLLPGTAAQTVLRAHRRVLSAEEKSRIEEGVRQAVAGLLAGEPAQPAPRRSLTGFVGYLKWISRDGRMTLPLVVEQGSCTTQARQKRGGWLFRVIISLPLLGFTILSQVLGLTRPPTEVGGSNDDKSPPTSYHHAPDPERTA